MMWDRSGATEYYLPWVARCLQGMLILLAVSFCEDLESGHGGETFWRDEFCSQAAGTHDSLAPCHVEITSIPHVFPNWEEAIRSYDPVRRTMWLEIDVTGLGKEPAAVCICPRQVAHRFSWTVVVKLSGEVKAMAWEAEGAVELSSVRVGRHWAEVWIEACDGALLGKAYLVEFVLPFHTHAVIMHPAHRSNITRREAELGIEICVRATMSSDCTEDCVREGPASISVDGHVVSILLALAAGEGPVCQTLPVSEELALAGRHFITVEYLGDNGKPIGPISYQHHVITLPDGDEGEGRAWLLAHEGLSGPRPLKDSAIDTGMLNPAGLINPSVYAAPGGGWRIVFREHQLKEEGVEGYLLRLEPSVQVKRTPTHFQHRQPSKTLCIAATMKAHKRCPTLGGAWAPC